MRTNTSRSGPSYLGSLDSLEFLHAGEYTTNSDISHIAHLPKLHKLDLCSSDITEKAIPWLSRMTQLRTLLIYNTWLTSEDVAILQQALPECKIEYSPRDSSRRPLETKPES